MPLVYLSGSSSSSAGRMFCPGRALYVNGVSKVLATRTGGVGVVICPGLTEGLREADPAQRSWNTRH